MKRFVEFCGRIITVNPILHLIIGNTLDSLMNLNYIIADDDACIYESFMYNYPHTRTYVCI